MRELENEIDVLRNNQASIERNQASIERDVASLLTSRAMTRKLLWLVIPALATGLVTALIYAGDKIAASAERVGRTEAKLEAYKERLDNEESEIGQLRAKLLQLSGVDPKTISVAHNN